MKKILSVILACAMIFALAIPAFAAEEDEKVVKFADVKNSDWFANDVAYVYSHGLMLGVGYEGDAVKFAPQDTTTRAMIAMIFWRMNDSPKPDELSTFVDVPEDAWYAEAIAWMEDVGLGNGIGDNKFGPEDPVTREQLATFLERFNFYFEYQPEFPDFELTEFVDADKIDDWAEEAMYFAVGTKVICGDDKKALNPTGFATRAEIAAMLHRFVLSSYDENFDLSKNDSGDCEHEFTETVVERACTTCGYTQHTCSKCGYSYKDQFVPKKGHQWTTIEYTMPTCTTNGHVVNQCVDCGAIDSFDTPAFGHSWILIDHQEPSENHDGYNWYKCSTCGEEKKEVIPAIGSEKLCGVIRWEMFA